MISAPTKSLAQAILFKFQAHPGAVMGAADFLDFGSRAAVDQALSRLVAKGAILRVGRGLYHRPQRHARLGELLPDGQAIAKALADKGTLRLQPAGAYAANLLGLSEQVPRRLVFLTDGASRKLAIAGQQIELRHTTPRNMATAGRVSGLVIQALRHLRREQVGASVVEALRIRLSAKEKALLLADVGFAPAWVAGVMRQVADQEGNA